ncbi:DUF6807 family protein [Maribacter flavus]|uniref:Methane oxygenase PmoA n=1 Tax=Maribacter flavus TaxID=1658664 RepID=A0A5B2TVI2_9FLAO|nr:DUF6807 family protein [Maribacter flavus]KAA2218344.1 hypothetical protein F0361_01600 [Maribacter flavus]
MSKSAPILFIVFVFCWGRIFSQQVDLHISDKNAVFLEGKDSVLVYQKEPKSLNGSYERANYIHPLFSLDGVSITEDFPEDHLHHRGIFWAWHQLYINRKRIGDGWEVKDFEWNVINTSETAVRNGAITLKNEVLWESEVYLDQDGAKIPFVSETNWITVYPRKGNYRVVDIKIQLYPLFDSISIGGSEDEKGYGGFSARVRLSEDVMFKDSEGKITPENTPVPGKNWINILSRVGKDKTPYGLTIIPSKDNLPHPNPWILRSQNSMQNAVYPFPGANPVPLSRESPLVLKYRLVVHDGFIQTTTLFDLQKEYYKLSE